jgi:hypothetical protein
MKDGTTLHLKGKNLSPDVIQQKISQFGSSAPKPDSPVVAGAKTFGREAALGGFSGLGIQEGTTPEKVLKNTGRGLWDSYKRQLIETALLGPGMPIAEGLQAGMGNLKDLKDIYQGIKTGDPGQAGHGVGSTVSQTIMALLGMKAGKGALEPGADIIGDQAAMRQLFGAGKGDVRIETGERMEKAAEVTKAYKEKVDDLNRKHAEAQQEQNRQHQQNVLDAQKKDTEARKKIDTEHQTKIDKVKKDYASDVAARDKAAKEASAKQTTAAQKQKGSVAHTRVEDMADEAQKHVANVRQEVYERNDENWNKFTSEMKNPNVEEGKTIDALTKAQGELTGENVPIFKQMMKDLIADPEEISKIEKIESPTAREYFRAAAKGSRDAEEGMKMDRARSFYTRLNNYLYKVDSGLVKRAGYQVLNALDESIGDAVVKKGGNKALQKYRQLQANYAEYARTFKDKTSPIRKFLDAKDSGAKARIITGEMGERAIGDLGKHAEADARVRKPGRATGVEQLGKIRALHRAIGGIKSTGAKTPEAVAHPEFPKKPAYPAATQVSPAEPIPPPEMPKVPDLPSTRAGDVRRDLIKKAEKAYSGPPRRFELLFPALLKFRMMMKQLVQSKAFQDYMLKNRGGPVP